MISQEAVDWFVYKLPLSARRRSLFVLSHHRLPHFANPSTFSDKVNWRILSDRRPLLEWTCDKLAMKQRAQGVPGLRVPRTFWSGTDLRDLERISLPEHWVLKPNHRSSGLAYFGHGGPDADQLSGVTQAWLRPREAADNGEWAYSKARPMFLVEELIGIPGSPPPDYKFFVFDGEVAAVQVDIGRHTMHQRRLYLPDWSTLDVRYGAYSLPEPEPPPTALADMLAIAVELADGFDFIRVDLYDTGGDVFFGEFTPYPCSGLDRFVPASFDAQLGARWALPSCTR